jgi:RNA polymerase sigma-70 factor (ECF subfamily)
MAEPAMDSVRTSIRDQIPALRRYARALVGDRDRADDLVQDCLLRAINAEAQWKPGTNLRAWLFTILHNVYVSEWRKQARRPALVSIESEAWRLEAPARQMSNVQVGELERALARLPDQQRLTVLLIGLHGMDYQEAAAIMGVPLGTVRSRLSRARRALLCLLGVGASETSAPEASGVAAARMGAARLLPAAQVRRSA